MMKRYDMHSYRMVQRDKGEYVKYSEAQARIEQLEKTNKTMYYFSEDAKKKLNERIGELEKALKYLGGNASNLADRIYANKALGGDSELHCGPPDFMG